MGQQPSRFNPLFRSDELDEIIKQLVMLIMDERNEDMEENNNTNKKPSPSTEELNKTLTKDEWNLVSLLCRSSKITFEHCAQHRARLQSVWAEGEAPRKNCPESSLLFALVCFLEAALGGTDLNSVSNRLINMMDLLQNNLAEMNPAKKNSSQEDVSEPERALNWAASLASQNNQDGNNCNFQLQNRVWNEISRDLRKITLVDSSSSSSTQIMEDTMLFKEPLKSWLTCLIIACYCVIVHRMASSSSLSTASLYSAKVNARAFGFFALSVCYKAKIRSNIVVDQLWNFLTEFELEENISTIVENNKEPSSFPLAPTVQTWEDIPKVYVGQSHALKDVGNLLRAKREGLVPSDKPTVILLYGPSGYGKTQLGKHISRVLRQQRASSSSPSSPTTTSSSQQQQTGADDIQSCIKLVEQEQQQALDQQDEDGTSVNPEDGSKDLLILNMANYCTETSLYSLIDPPSGIVGEGGLIRAIQKNPKMVIVADEFEKSTALAINNLWLPAFETNGKLASGKDPLLKVPTKDVTFVLTCNLCDKEILEGAGAYHDANEEGKKKMRDSWNALLGKRLSEFMQNNAFLPRISKVIPFVPFTNSELEKYVSLQIEAFQRHQLRRNVQFFYSHAVVEKLAKNVKNFHTRSVDAALLDHMLKASDANANSVVLTVATEQPQKFLTEADLCNQVFIHNSFDFSPKQNLHSYCGTAALEAIVAAREQQMVKSQNGTKNISEMIEWLKNDKLGKNRSQVIRAEAEVKMIQWRKEKEEQKQKKDQELKRHQEELRLMKEKQENEKKESVLPVVATPKDNHDEEIGNNNNNIVSSSSPDRNITNTAAPTPLENNNNNAARSGSSPIMLKSTNAVINSANSIDDITSAASPSPSPAAPHSKLQQQQQKVALAYEKHVEKKEDKKHEEEKKLQEKKQHEIDIESKIMIEKLQIQNAQHELQKAQQEDLISDLKLQMKELQNENSNLKLEVKKLKELVKSLQTALALALIASLSFMLMASLFLPMKVVLLTALAVALTINHFVSNFSDILLASCEAVYNYLGPRNIGGIVLAMILWSLFVGNYYYSAGEPLPCV